MNKICTLLFFLATIMPAMSQQMVVESNGKTENIEFSNLDKITFNEKNVIITQVGGKELQATMGDIDRIMFSNYNGICSVDCPGESLFRYLSNDALAVNCSAGELVCVYDVVGNQLICVRQNSDNGTVGIAQLPKGIYIIRVNDRTAKFLKK